MDEVKTCPVVRSGVCTCDAAVGLLDVVEPQGRQVQHLSGLHAAAERPRSPVLRVPVKVRVQRVQRDPRDLWGGGGRRVRVKCVLNRAGSVDINRHLNAPSQSRFDRRPQTRRRPADGRQQADTHLTHGDGYYG